MIGVGTDWLAEIPGFQLIQGSPSAAPVTGISTDSRSLSAGEVFVAIRGERFDGHEYIDQAIRAGAAALVLQRDIAARGDVQQSFQGAGVPVLLVENTHKALAQMAHSLLGCFNGRILVVAGSNGKTTTKDLVAKLLSTRYPVIHSPASFNNAIGVPLTIFQLLSKPCEWLVLEMGTNHPGELPELLSIAPPHAGILTNIGPEHLEYFIDLDGVAREELSLPAAIRRGGFCVLNADCDRSMDAPGLPGLAEGVRFLTAGCGALADFRISGVEVSRDGTSFAIESSDPSWSGRYFTPLVGAHQAVNASQAMAVAREAGCDPDAVAAALRDCAVPRWRMEISTAGESTVIRDCYNANPASVQMAMQSLVQLGHTGRKILVIGAIAEMGDAVLGFYQSLPDMAGAAGAYMLVTVGLPPVPMTASGPRIMQFGTGAEAAFFLAGIAEPGDTILFKASRSARLEHCADIFERELSRRTHSQSMP